MNLLKNSIQCNHCKDIITSRYRHDFKLCKCGAVGIDGGISPYSVRRLFKEHPDKDYTNMSVVDNASHNLRRTHLEWGSDYDIDMKPLKETLWRPIKDLEIDHIWKILELFEDKLPKVYRDTFEDEIIYRESFVHLQSQNI